MNMCIYMHAPLLSLDLTTGQSSAGCAMCCLNSRNLDYDDSSKGDDLTEVVLGLDIE